MALEKQLAYLCVTNKDNSRGKGYEPIVGNNLLARYQGGTGKYLEWDSEGNTYIRAGLLPHQVQVMAYDLKDGYKLFEIEGTPTDGFNKSQPTYGCFREVMVRGELPTWQLWGPNGQAVEMLVNHWKKMNPDQAKQVEKESKEIFESLKSKTFWLSCDTGRFRASTQSAELIAIKDQENILASVALSRAASALVVADLLSESELMVQVNPFLAACSDEERERFLSLLPSRPQLADIEFQRRNLRPYNTTWISPRFTVHLPIQVSGRDEDQVSKLLRLRKDAIPQGDKVLSVGEGLSDFAKKIGAWAVDPIYEIEGLFEEKSPLGVKERLEYAYEGRVTYREDYQKNRKIVPMPNPEMARVGTANNLPFDDQSFDTVLASELLSYIDLVRSIPELVRVLTPEGELRISGLRMQLNYSEKNKYLVPGFIAANSYTGKSNFLAAEGLDLVMKFIEEGDLSFYAVTTNPADYEGLYQAGCVIIRRDNRVPDVLTYTQKEWDLVHEDFAKAPWKKAFPALGKLFKISPTPLEVNDEHFSTAYPAQSIQKIKGPLSNTGYFFSLRRVGHSF